MFDRSQKQDRPPIGAIEFELTDFEVARQVLDELPAGLDPAHGDPSYWVSKRRPPMASDRALTGSALDWMVSLPPPLRPQQLGRLFPRIANALAQVWVDRGQAMQALDGLLVDRRGGRRGLPDTVQAELLALQVHLKSRPGTAPAPVATLASASAAARAETPELLHARRLLEAAGYRVIAPAR
jgi:hypothetical protein